MWRQTTTAGTILLLLLLCSGVVVAGDARLCCAAAFGSTIYVIEVVTLSIQNTNRTARTTAETAVRGGGAGKRLRRQARAYCCPLNWLSIALLLRTTAAAEVQQFFLVAVVDRCGRCRLESG